MTPTVRPAVAADATAVTALMGAQLRELGLEPDPAIAAAVIGVLERPERGLFLVATSGTTLVGAAFLSRIWSLEHAGASIWLDELYVSPEHRGHGTGTALLRAALTAAREEGAEAIDLEVLDDGARVKSLYVREGFTRLNRRRWAKRLG